VGEGTKDFVTPPLFCPTKNDLHFIMTLQEWLSHIENTHPTSIDLGLERVSQVAQRMGLKFSVPVITVAGTNGKGSTCAMLEAILSQAGYKVGLYTSPHLVQFQERCRVREESVSEEALLEAFEHVQAHLEGTSLTYFEFSTLAILWILSRSDLDVVVLEVGLGGRLDAVNVVDADCAVITSIDLDHMDYLGPDRESIGLEKAGIMRAHRPVVISDPLPPQSVLRHAQEVSAEVWQLGKDFNFAGDPQQWAWRGRGSAYSGLAYPALRGANQLLNASGVLAALTSLRAQIPVTAQAVRNGLAMVELPGRFQIFPGQPQLVLDVAHNPHAVAALTENLDAMGFFPKTHAVFGAMKDKDIEAIMRRIGVLVDDWYFCDLPTARAASAQRLHELWQKTPLAAQQKGDVFNSPYEALQACLAQASPTDRIVVFGSFYTVGDILAKGIPRRDAPHLNA
jgi:dihydrofolate synthase / folylpolyglutamate synthase